MCSSFIYSYSGSSASQTVNLPSSVTTNYAEFITEAPTYVYGGTSFVMQMPGLSTVSFTSQGIGYNGGGFSSSASSYTAGNWLQYVLMQDAGLFGSGPDTIENNAYSSPLYTTETYNNDGFNLPVP